ncbi:uncharacterized protein BDR25DRAFT_391429 [Lindgomyces ingoldianus]|uniref:Uncharacterized protein n=1 Tax=Lindgomyces ingoldianus TaxID=673940 RepID=A0ACB6R7H5_9PLEO|nr:uncharacterized protein BDR25DRAFT_391429 [Lindgomyces ingoldianus]KAF2475121.1 hypothetical protein BDR25DRAFT_391429 [Lindgomyces ingoldianus]
MARESANTNFPFWQWCSWVKRILLRDNFEDQRWKRLVDPSVIQILVYDVMKDVASDLHPLGDLTTKLVNATLRSCKGGMRWERSMISYFPNPLALIIRHRESLFRLPPFAGPLKWVINLVSREYTFCKAPIRVDMRGILLHIIWIFIAGDNFDNCKARHAEFSKGSYLISKVITKIPPFRIGALPQWQLKRMSMKDSFGPQAFVFWFVHSLHTIHQSLPSRLLATFYRDVVEYRFPMKTLEMLSSAVELGSDPPFPFFELSPQRCVANIRTSERLRLICGRWPRCRGIECWIIAAPLLYGNCRLGGKKGNLGDEHKALVQEGRNVDVLGFLLFFNLKYFAVICTNELAQTCPRIYGCSLLNVPQRKQGSTTNKAKQIAAVQPRPHQHRQLDTKRTPCISIRSLWNTKENAPQPKLLILQEPIEGSRGRPTLLPKTFEIMTSGSKLSAAATIRARLPQNTPQAVPIRPPTGGKDKSSSNENTSKDIIALLNEEVDRELYPKLIFLKTLSPFKDGPVRRDSSGGSIDEHRRRFLDAFAYLCDVEKGGGTVTACALQKVNGDIVMWLAANEQIRPVVVDFAKDVLKRLKNVTVEERKGVEEEILDVAVKKGKKRIAFYRTRLGNCAEACCEELVTKSGELAATQSEPFSYLEDDFLRTWVKNLKKELGHISTLELVKFCYGLRGDGLELLRARSLTEDDCFGQLAHLVGRLGAHKSKVLTLVEAMLEVPSLRNIGDIRAASSPPKRKVRVVPETTHHYDMILGICRKESIVNTMQARQALHALCDLELEHGLDLRGKIEAESSIDTRVHAELILVDLFARGGFGFVENDRYIGCSKPACYFCFNWIALHYARYVRPATHNKIILGCRGLDSELNATGRNRLKGMNKKMIDQVEKDIIQALLERQAQGTRARAHHMSSEGSSRAQSDRKGFVYHSSIIVSTEYRKGQRDSDIQ